MSDAMEKADLDWQHRTLPLPDSAELRQALADANINTLLMVYVHLTHDEAMLDEFSVYIRPPFANPPSEIPEEYANDLHEKLCAVLTSPDTVDKGDPSAALMQKMMSVGVGERVDDEFLPLLYDQIGFKLPAPRKALPDRPLPPSGFKLLVIGAGLTGLVAGIKLEEAGYDYVTIEKNPEVGGTWYENIYPGVGVDTPSHFYSYSFEISPHWNHYHPHGADMQKYLLYVADKYDLRSKIQFNSRVVSLKYDDARNLWKVAVRRADGTTDMIEANAVINGRGTFNQWEWPKIAGLQDFKGIMMHTAGWDPSVDVAGKRVAVIGTGASSAQLIPALAPKVGQLTIFQRSKHWVINNPEIVAEVPDSVKWALRHIPHYREWFRFRIYWFAADGLYPNVLLDPDWPKDSPSVSAINEGMRQFSLAHMKAKLGDRPDLIEKLTPDFPIFSKRITMDGGLFDALKRDNVALEVGGIECITPTGIRTKDGAEHEFDIIVCATGFNVAQMTGGMEIIGREGRDLNEEWGLDDPRSYLGVAVCGYPNYFLTTGPNSAPNHAAGQNLVSECQINYIIECLDLAIRNGKTSVEPTRQVFDDWNAKVDEQMKTMIWSHPRARSYYKNNRGRPFLSWPWRLVDYWNETRQPEDGAFILR